LLVIGSLGLALLGGRRSSLADCGRWALVLWRRSLRLVLRQQCGRGEKQAEREDGSSREETS
jgi:hypothetical protein